MTSVKLGIYQKNLLMCKRHFTWRKKWERVWDEVKHCSDARRKNAKQKNPVIL